MWLIILSDQLPIADLVGFYSANYLMGRKLVSRPRRFNNCLDVKPLHHPGLVPLSRNYTGPEGRLFTCYSPVRHSLYNIATVKQVDLHVLGTPPAFVLSQDQTLRCNKLLSLILFYRFHDKPLFTVFLVFSQEEFTHTKI